MAALILVNGHPGSGKTTLARWLANELGVPCLSKDLFKETLYGRLPPADRDASRALGRAAYDLMYATADAVLASGTSVILEAPLHREFAQGQLDSMAAEHGATLLQLLLAADPEVLETRYLARQSSGDRHEGHDVGFTAEELRLTVATPIDAPEVAATFEIDTNDFGQVDRRSIVAWINERGAMGSAAS